MADRQERISKRGCRQGIARQAVAIDVGNPESSRDPWKPIWRAVSEFVMFSLLSLLPTLTIFIDIRVLGHGVPDRSVTEWAQEFLLLGSALLFWTLARRRAEHRGFYVLAAGVLSCMFIREMDKLLDNVHKGFWVWPVALVAGVSVVTAFVAYRQTILPGMVYAVQSRAYPYMMFGVLTVVVFAQIFGSGSLLWRHLMQSEYHSVFKSALQEGLELYGYLFIFYGACRFGWTAGGRTSPACRPG